MSFRPQMLNEEKNGVWVIESTLQEGLAQTWAYADRCAAEEAHLVIFDRTPGKSWDERLWRRAENLRGLPITVWGM